MQPARKMLPTIDDTQKAGDLNGFLLKFDTQNFDLECKMELSYISAADLGDNRVLIDCDQVQSLFKQMCSKESAGPDGSLSFLLKVCAEELSPVWCSIFQRSIDAKVVPAIWKKSHIISVPKTARPVVNNDFRPIALTLVVMKCYEKCMV